MRSSAVVEHERGAKAPRFQFWQSECPGKESAIAASPNLSDHEQGLGDTNAATSYPRLRRLTRGIFSPARVKTLCWVLRRKLGRALVYALHKGKLELPSDILAVVYIEMDDAGST